ncbi:sulfite reductase subunit beta [Lyophyllum atratum]|nr:sulfite reductase subunit beta [Lyophyllum atratum]
MSALSAVARIAYLASDVVVDSQPTLPLVSAFSETFTSLANTSQHKPKLLSAPFGADPGEIILRNADTGLVSFTTSSYTQVLTRLVLHLAEISSRPVVLHIALKDDLSDAILLRSAVPYFLFSSTPQQAHDNALLASRLARIERKAVVHAFYPGVTQDPLSEIPEEKILPFLLSEKHPASPGHVTPINGEQSTFSAELADDPTLLALYKSYEAAALETLSQIRRPLRPLSVQGPADPHTVLLIFGQAPALPEVEGVSYVFHSLLSPLLPSRLLDVIPVSAKRVIVLEQIHRWTTKWLPLYLEVASALQQRDTENRPTVQSGVLGSAEGVTAADIGTLLEQATATTSLSIRLSLGVAPSLEAQSSEAPHVPRHELAYTKILSQIFNERLEVANSPSLVPSQGKIATSPEYALGRVRGQLDLRADLIAAVQELLQDGSAGAQLHSLLSKWIIAKDDPVKSKALGLQIIQTLSDAPITHPAAARLLALKAHFPAVSRWIIGSDAWSYDLGASGLHHAIASGLNVNILLLDTLPYSQRNAADPHRRKHDVGLYAMNHGDVFVASVAVFSSYSQVLQSLMEADRFPGPAVVLAYLPYTSEDVPALDVLKETKLAVDAGYWPLYRWDPSKEQAGKEPFSLDSDALKHDLQTFLDRQNHLSQLTRATPQLAAELVGSLGEQVKAARRAKAKQAYGELLSAVDAPPLLVLYASDGGAAEKTAKRLAGRGKARGLAVTVAAMDTVPLESLKDEEHVAFVTSVAGQGEPPQNGRQLFKAINAAVARGETLFGKLKYTVFGMGDSHYWPRPEDAHYYNKPGKDLDARLEKLGGVRIAALGLGDDQDADGWKTGYEVWEPLLWKAMGVDAVEVTEAEPEPITNEHIKAASGYLRGTIAEGLEDTTTGALAPSDGQLTKFHGIYQQDDRDIRDERQAQGVEPAYSFMIRVRMPGGVCKPSQWLQMDQIADEHGSGTFKITTRQTFQFHGVIKRHLKPAIQDINRVLLDTLAACGDVNRNVVCSSIPTLSRLHEEVYQFSKDVSEHLIPRTTAYHEIWLDKKMVAGEALRDHEPLYGEFYLPRKFKIAVAVPPTNDVDVFANDLGFIAIVGKNGELEGFNVSIGGGMGVTHGNKKTYPRIGDVVGFCTPDQGRFVAESIMLTQRDNGNRADRKNARLKYTIDRMGLDVFKADFEKRLGYKLAPARPYTFDRNVDDYGWFTGEDGRHHYTVFIENGRIQDEPGRDFKTGLREIAKIHKGTFRLTTNQHLLVSDIADEDLGEIKRLLAKYKLDNLNHSGLRLASSACVAFPTCGLAMAESERYLPLLIDKVEKICEVNGLRNDSIVMRMTGCPNGCARPYVAEIAFVGKAPGTYSMLLGGGYYGQRMNKIYRETVTEPEILAILEPMIKRYALEREHGEKFGDFTIRAGYISATTSGKEWYVGMGGEGQWKEDTVEA